MKILLIHNRYAKYSGEEAVFSAQETLLRANGHEVRTYTRSSEEIKEMPFGKTRSFFTGMYNRRSVQEIRDLVRPLTSNLRPPSIVHIHNLYPLISPSILPVIKSARNISKFSNFQIFKSSNLQIFKSSNLQISKSSDRQITSSPKIVMTVHNYRLVCPNGLFFTHGEICERCAGGKEWNCVIRNCEGSVFKSAGYALRNRHARKRRYYLDHVDAFLCLTRFQKAKLVENGFPAEKCHVLPNFLEKKKEQKDTAGKFVFWAGRINAQKGFDILAKAATLLPGIPIRAAGSDTSGYLRRHSLPGNITPAGKLSAEEMERSFGEAAFLVFTSRSYEGFPVVFLEAMAAGIPVIAPRMAGFPEIIGDGVNGLLFEPGDADDLAEKMSRLWNDREQCRKLGNNGYHKLITHYSPEVYYQKLMSIYESLL